MKPIALELTAFGAFAGTEVIDFTSLAPRGVFVVSGDTGTGKTTIFDAMCWALYGEMPLKESQEVRSDHVAPEVRTEVRFTFECGGTRYMVVRHPAQLKPAQRGKSSVNETAGAQLFRITGSGTEALATKASQTTTECERLIGLDAKQFQRVILLPQGDFSRFLLAGTDDRENLLSKLFGGRVFDDIVEQLKAERDGLRRELGDTDAKIAAKLDEARTNLGRAREALGLDTPEDVAEADRDSVRSLLDSLVEPVAARRLAVDELAAADKAAADALKEAADATQRHDQAAVRRDTLEKLDADQTEVEQRAKAARASEAARPVATAADELETALDRAEAAADERDEALRGVADGFSSLDVTADTASVSAVKDQLTSVRESHKAQRAALEAVAEAGEALAKACDAQGSVATEAEETREKLDVLTGRKVGIEAALPGLREAAVDVAAIKAEIARARERAEARSSLDSAEAELSEALEASATAVDRHRTLLEAFVATEAPRLAATLEDGMPCPVCGATDHPRPAVTDGDAATTFDQVQDASNIRDGANRAVTDLQARVVSLRTRLGEDVDTTESDLADRVAGLQDNLDTATKAHEDVAQLEKELETSNSDVRRVAEKLAGLEEQARLAAQTVGEATGTKEQAEADAEGIDPGEMERAGGVLDDLEHLVGGLEARFAKVTEAEGEAKSCQRRLDELLAASTYASAESARAVLVDVEEERAAAEAAASHARRRTEAEAALDALAELGIPDTRPDLDAVSAEAVEAQKAHEQARGELTVADNNHRYTREALEAHDELVGGSADLRTEAELLDRAHEVCNKGGPGAEMSLKRWVLTRELDRVTAAANVHLHRMTNLRYMLQRKVDRGDARKKFGLDLEVTDSSTGRARSTRSLSGGEQFQASLALALGLADVVSQGGTASGKTFEALFVDEGFGSLSAESLDDAIETLHQLHATGRMVGAITHVDAMKQNLHVGIAVTRREDGCGSTLVVRP